VEKLSEKVLEEREGLAGGGILEGLLKLKDVLVNLNPKICYWVLFAFGLLFGSWTTVTLVLLCSFFAVWASYRCSPRPEGIPLAPPGLDVLLGRTVDVSRHAEGQHANNNVSLCTFKDRYIVAYRNSDTHWPSGKTKLIVVSSKDMYTWKEEWTYSNGCDLREMLLFELGGQLMLYYFSLKPAGNAFHPLHVYCTTSPDASTWAAPREVCRKGEVPWDIKVRDLGEGPLAWKASYVGDHYGAGDMLCLFEKSKDGIKWEPVGKADSSVVYRGGVCEVAFEFTAKGDLVAIGRNEDGDDSGFGTQLFYAKKDDLGTWTKLRVSVPWRFDSPRMVRSAATGDILLFARYTANRFQLAPKWMQFTYQKVLNLVLYNVLPKSAAIYRIAPPEEWSGHTGGANVKAVQLVRFFERAFGDTGFFSLAPELPQTSPTAVQICRCRVVSEGKAA